MSESLDAIAAQHKQVETLCSQRVLGKATPEKGITYSRGSSFYCRQTPSE
mgnify:CR=1 FL=1|jgi:hypothetical protein